MIYVVLVAIIYLSIAHYIQGKEYRRITNELIALVKETQGIAESNAKTWDKERQQLLDRIQAPSYDHLKHHEVKIIKAQNTGKEEPKLEVL